MSLRDLSMFNIIPSNIRSNVNLQKERTEHSKVTEKNVSCSSVEVCVVNYGVAVGCCIV
jgi:hypothetical protein